MKQKTKNKNQRRIDMLSPKKLLCAFAVSLGFALAMPFLTYAESINIPNELLLKAYSSTGAEMVLTSDITLTQNLVVNADSSIDLNGHTLTLGDTTIAPFATLTILDSSAEQTGTLVNTGYFIVQVGNSSNFGSLVIESGTFDATNAQYGAIRNYGEVVMNGGVIRASDYGLYAQADSVFTMNGGLIEIVDGHGTGILLSKPGSKFIMNGGEIRGLATYVNDSGKTLGAAGVAAFKDTEVIINGGTIHTYSFPVMGNGSGAEGGINDGRFVKFTVNGGTLISESAAAIYAPQQQGETLITGGTLTGKTGIEIRAGKLTITGGEFNSTNDVYDATNYTNGLATWGATVSVQQHTTKQPIDVTISGGTFNSHVPLSVTNSLNYGDDIFSLVTVKVDGGTFNSDQGTPVVSALPLSFITGGVFDDAVTPFVVDGYGELPLDNEGTVEVVPYHNITIENESVDYITLSTLRGLYKQVITYSVVDDPILKEIVELIDENDEVTVLDGGEFVLPDSDVTIRVRHVEFARYTVTFRVANGTWSDGGTEDIEIVLVEDEDGNVVLRASDYPSDMIPEDGFVDGLWSHLVNGEENIDEDLVLVFEFKEEEIEVPATSSETTPKENNNDATDDGLDIPDTGANTNSDSASKIGSIAGIVALAAGVIVFIGSATHVVKEVSVDDVD